MTKKKPKTIDPKRDKGIPCEACRAADYLKLFLKSPDRTLGAVSADSYVVEVFLDRNAASDIASYANDNAFVFHAALFSFLAAVDVCFLLEQGVFHRAHMTLEGFQLVIVEVVPRCVSFDGRPRDRPYAHPDLAVRAERAECL